MVEVWTKEKQKKKCRNVKLDRVIELQVFGASLDEVRERKKKKNKTQEVEENLCALLLLLRLDWFLFVISLCLFANGLSLQFFCSNTKVVCLSGTTSLCARVVSVVCVWISVFVLLHSLQCSNHGFYRRLMMLSVEELNACSLSLETLSTAAAATIKSRVEDWKNNSKYESERKDIIWRAGAMIPLLEHFTKVCSPCAMHLACKKKLSNRHKTEGERERKSKFEEKNWNISEQSKAVRMLQESGNAPDTMQRVSTKYWEKWIQKFKEIFTSFEGTTNFTDGVPNNNWSQDSVLRRRERKRGRGRKET